MIDTIVISILTVLLITSLYGLAFLKKKQIDLVLQLTQSKIDIGILNNKIAQINEDKKLVESEEFMQFLTSSREYAFDYIEAVQYAIDEYNKVVGPILKYHDTYGLAFGLDSLHYKNLEAISQAHKQMMEIMPSDPNKTNEGM